MRLYTGANVYDEALKRIRWIYSEFDNIYVTFSGGKDSTTVLNLAIKVATELDRLPVEVVFIDQEGEWQCVIDYIRKVSKRDEIKLHWLQVPIKLFNASSQKKQWLHCWDPADEEYWMREKEPNSIHENVYGTDRFGKMFPAFWRYNYPKEPVAVLGGVRTEESPSRLLGLTQFATYKGETWGRVESKPRQHFVFYPIYDWSYVDVWKFIEDNGLDYCELYDKMFQYGIPVRAMRVSNVHHETALTTLFFLQEIEPKTWQKLTQRLPGINTVGQLKEQFFKPKELPFMFESWAEYRDHLLENLIADEKTRSYFTRTFEAYADRWSGLEPGSKDEMNLHRTQIMMILVNDYHGTKLDQFASTIKIRQLHQKDNVPLEQKKLLYDELIREQKESENE
jgi:predicted phosphoadenosine phosphosulfate sulfurtransferase